MRTLPGPGSYFLASVVLIALLSSPLPALSADSGNPAATIVPKQPKVICRKEKVLGSHFKQRVCRTDASIAQDQQDARKQLGELQDFQARTWQQEEGLELNR